MGWDVDLPAWRYELMSAMFVRTLLLLLLLRELRCRHRSQERCCESQGLQQLRATRDADPYSFSLSRHDPKFGEAMALQTGIMNNHFANVPIKTELFVKVSDRIPRAFRSEKFILPALAIEPALTPLILSLASLFVFVPLSQDRWSGLPAIDGAAQVQAMP